MSGGAERVDEIEGVGGASTPDLFKYEWVTEYDVVPNSG